MPKTLTASQSEELLATLKARFEKHQNRHPELNWANLEAKLMANPAKLWSLNEMETTGGEPDVVGYDKSTDEFTFFDCSPESPKGRRSLCYDQAALNARKEHKPVGSAVEVASEMGIQLLNEDQYRELQSLGEFDLKTSSWVQTPAAIRKLDGSLFGDRRYNQVFFYHNGASSYYAARGFRGFLKV